MWYNIIYGSDILKDLFIGIFYVILTTSMIYYNYKYFEFIKNEEKNFPGILYDIPNSHLQQIKYILCYIQGLLILIVLFVLLKELISFYRGLKDFILVYIIVILFKILNDFLFFIVFFIFFHAIFSSFYLSFNYSNNFVIR